MNPASQRVNEAPATGALPSEPAASAVCTAKEGRGLAVVVAEEKLAEAQAGAEDLKMRFAEFDKSVLPKINTVKELKAALDSLRNQHGELTGNLHDLGNIEAIGVATTRGITSDVAQAALEFNKGDPDRFSEVITREVANKRRERIEHSLTENIEIFEGTLKQKGVSDAASQAVLKAIRPHLEKIISPLTKDPINGELDRSKIKSFIKSVVLSVENKVKLKVPGETNGFQITEELGTQLSDLVSNLSRQAEEVLGSTTKEFSLSGPHVKAEISTDDLGRGTIRFSHGNSLLGFELDDRSGNVHQRLKMIGELVSYLQMFDDPHGDSANKPKWKAPNAEYTIGLIQSLGIRSELEWRPVRPVSAPGAVAIRDDITTATERAIAIVAGEDNFSLHSVNSPFSVSVKTDQGYYKIALDRKVGVNSFVPICRVEGKITYVGPEGASRTMMDSLAKALDGSASDSKKFSEIPVLGVITQISGARLSGLSGLEIDKDITPRCSDSGCEISSITVESGRKVCFRGDGDISLDRVAGLKGSSVSVHSEFKTVVLIDNSTFDTLAVPHRSSIHNSEAKYITSAFGSREFDPNSISTEGCVVSRRLMGLLGLGAQHSLQRS